MELRACKQPTQCGPTRTWPDTCVRSSTAKPAIPFPGLLRLIEPHFQIDSAKCAMPGVSQHSEGQRSALPPPARDIPSPPSLASLAALLSGGCECCRLPWFVWWPCRLTRPVLSPLSKHSSDLSYQETLSPANPIFSREVCLRAPGSVELSALLCQPCEERTVLLLLLWQGLFKGLLLCPSSFGCVKAALTDLRTGDSLSLYECVHAKEKKIRCMTSGVS